MRAAKDRNKKRREEAKRKLGLLGRLRGKS